MADILSWWSTNQANIVIIFDVVNIYMHIDLVNIHFMGKKRPTVFISRPVHGGGDTWQVEIKMTENALKYFSALHKHTHITYTHTVYYYYYYYPCFMISNDDYPFEKNIKNKLKL